MNKYGWELPSRDITDKYEERCEAFVKDDSLFANFKQDPEYTKVLEGNEPDVGLRALQGINKWGDIAREFMVANLNRFKENENIGNPKLLNFGGYIGKVAPSTLRYINTCVEIQQAFDSGYKRIIEIGGGYGGLCKTFNAFFGDFDKYTIIDSPWASKLTEKYLSKFKLGGVTCVAVDNLDSVDTEDIDLCIADSSLSECNMQTQLLYIDKIVKHAKFAYIVYNTVQTQGGFYRFRRLLEELTKTFNVEIQPISERFKIGNSVDRLTMESLLCGIVITAIRK